MRTWRNPFFNGRQRDVTFILYFLSLFFLHSSNEILMPNTDLNDWLCLYALCGCVFFGLNCWFVRLNWVYIIELENHAIYFNTLCSITPTTKQESHSHSNRLKFYVVYAFMCVYLCLFQAEWKIPIVYLKISLHKREEVKRSAGNNENTW